MSTTPTPAPKASTPSNTLETLLYFVKHPGTNTGAGLALAALSTFTASVPVADRTATTIIGLAYALATQVVDYLKAATTA